MNIDKGRYWDKAWTLVDGCTPVSAGCDNCWSAAMTHRFKQGLTDKGKFNGAIKMRKDNLKLPLKTKKPTVFAVWNDLFHKDISIEFIADAFEIMTSCRCVFKKRHEHDEDCETEETGHKHLILTKHPERTNKIIKELPDYLEGNCHYDSALKLGIEYGTWLDDIYFGTSVENQQTADERIPYLLQVPGKKFLSIEPMLNEIIIPQKYLKQISQVICGGETGHNARPCHPDWVRSLREQCRVAGVPFFFKGWGQGKHLRLLDGRTHDELVWLLKP